MKFPAASCRAAIVFAGLALAAAAFQANAAQDPKVPHGLDPGGLAIAFIGDGVDYTDPEIAARLARDGEGEPIALDLVDGDVRPYAAAESGRGTELAKLLLSTYKNSRLVVVRADTGNALSLARAAAFVSRTPSKIAAVASWGREKETWQPFSETVSQQGSHVLFVVPGGDERARSDGLNYPAQFRLKNTITAAPFDPPANQYAPAAGDESVEAWVVGAGASMFGAAATPGPRDSIEAAILLAGQAGCALHGADPAQPADAAGLKAAVLARARAVNASGINTKVHDPMCWYGGVLLGGPGGN